ncbi:hypothetical protein [Metabacillus litoralis]|uniref:hypothetical protein n=1 Tax=Metabacillus litoralis TaxID=152268 RepID=UPI00203E9DFF|nr:hypothetical protein [Metabacillus litoralis]MCM3161018.1 hypothetical protein [Metabacillus litoralis]
MQKTVDLNEQATQMYNGIEDVDQMVMDAYKINRKTVLNKFIENKGKYEPDFILDVVANQVIQLAFKNYCREDLLTYIGTGVIFLAKEQLVNTFLDDPEIADAYYQYSKVI